MIDRPDFSRDTGAGVPGVDNTHIPGQAYSSHREEDAGCGFCRTRVGYWEHNGSTVYGTEGQQEAYVWSRPPSEIPAKCTVCDDCLKPLIERADLEIYRNADGTMSKAIEKPSMRALFTMAAREVMADFIELKGGPQTEQEFVLPITQDEIKRMMRFACTLGNMEDFLDAGRHYATAVLAFEKVLSDPGFEKAAVYYADIWPFAGMTKEEMDQVAMENIIQMFMEAGGTDDEADISV